MSTFTVHTDSDIDPMVTVEADEFDWVEGIVVFTASGQPGGNRWVAAFNAHRVIWIKANREAE